MNDNFNKVKGFLADLDLDITKEDVAEELVVVNDESRGIMNLVLDCEGTILIIEQFIFKNSMDNVDTYKRLLQMNRKLVHGAFVLNEEGDCVIYRDTLQLEHLDLNELEGSITSLSLGLAEFSSELIEFAK